MVQEFEGALSDILEDKILTEGLCDDCYDNSGSIDGE